MDMILIDQMDSETWT